MKKGLFCGRGRGSAFSFCLAKKKTLAKEKGAWGDFEFPPGPPESDQENHFGFPGPFLRRVPAWRNHCRALHPEAKRDGTQAVPYAEIGIFTECSEQFRRGRPMCRPAVRTQANPYRLPNFIGSCLPHRLKRSCYQTNLYLNRTRYMPITPQRSFLSRREKLGPPEAGPAIRP